MSTDQRMFDRFGVEPVYRRRRPSSPRWLWRARGGVPVSVEEFWNPRLGGAGGHAMAPHWDHTAFWERDGWRYITTQPYNFAKRPDALYRALTDDLGDGYPRVCVDIYDDDHVWHDWTILAVLRLIEAPPLAPGAIFSTQFDREAECPAW